MQGILPIIHADIHYRFKVYDSMLHICYIRVSSARAPIWHWPIVSQLRATSFQSYASEITSGNRIVDTSCVTSQIIIPFCGFSSRVINYTVSNARISHGDDEALSFAVFRFNDSVADIFYYYLKNIFEILLQHNFISISRNYIEILFYNYTLRI